MDEPKQIGLLIGREWSWPSAFMAEINDNFDNVKADLIKIGPSFSDGIMRCDVIIDRMSHEIPYYRTYLKFAALHGCRIMNNPFMAAADDKFFGISLGKKLAIPTPKTVALPNKRVDTETVPESFRNLIYPMDWQGIIDYVGVPAILKDVHTGGRRAAYRVNNVDELIRWYDESDTLTLILQEIIESDTHLHFFVVGQKRVMAARYSLGDARYLDQPVSLPPTLQNTMTESALALTRAYGYDINMVEFVMNEGQAYLINPSNPAPEMDVDLLSAEQFSWCVREISAFAVNEALNPKNQFQQYEWFQATSS